MTDSNQHSVAEAMRQVTYALETLRDCGDRPGMYEDGKAALEHAAVVQAELQRLIEQLQAVQKHRDQLADMAREQEDENRRLLEQLEASERRASRNASAADIYKKQAEENGKAAIREEHRAETLEEQLQTAEGERDRAKQAALETADALTRLEEQLETLREVERAARVYVGEETIQLWTNRKEGDLTGALAKKQWRDLVIALAASSPASRLHALTTDDSQNEPPDLKVDDDFQV